MTIACLGGILCLGQLFLQLLASLPQLLNEIRLLDEMEVLLGRSIFTLGGGAAGATSPAWLDPVALMPLGIALVTLQFHRSHTFTFRFWQFKQDSVRLNFFPVRGGREAS